MNFLSFRSSRLRRPRRGFTLIELLTVIAIIGVLAGILIPVIGAVRASAQSAKTVSHLRQIQTANIAYANDNKGFYLGNAPFGSGQYSNPWFSYMPFLNYLGIKGQGDGLRDAWETGYPEVLKTGRQVSVAPAPRDDRNFTIAMNTTGWSHKQDGSPVSSKWGFFGHWNAGKNHMSKIQAPARFITFFESANFMAGMYDRTSWTGDNGQQYMCMAFRNRGGRCNVVFADGHVAGLTLADVKDDNAVTNRYFWWDPN